MKRFLIYLAFALPMLLLGSCDDDGNDLPDVDFVIDVTGGVYYDGQLYVVAGQDLTVNSIQVINNEQGKQAMISYADYYWDYIRVAQSVVAPFGVELYINPDTPVGPHSLEIYAPVYATDKSPAFSLLSYTVNVVADEADLPAEGATSFTANPRISESEPDR